MASANASAASVESAAVTVIATPSSRSVENHQGAAPAAPADTAEARARPQPPRL